jgi:hypothetical protein
MAHPLSNHKNTPAASPEDAKMTTNPIESNFATVATLTMIFNLGLAAQKQPTRNWSPKL